MRILSLLIIALFMVFINQKTDSPHGASFKVSCKTCHSPKGWYLDKTIYSFDHSKTSMKLSGQHARIDCRQCHVSLVFSEAKSNCSDCHNDVHQGTTGLDCSRCHTSESWLVSNINHIHDLSRFPLLGAHRTADCNQCHKSENPVRFDVRGIECIDCHRTEYLATTNPNHQQSGISQDCASCHKMNAFEWTGTGYNHDFFPLVQAHSTVKCSDCHTSGVYTGLSPDCFSCHQADYNAAKNPDHAAAKFSTVCTTCHSLSPGWKPSTFNHSSFPLNLGHSTVACTDCHIGGNYSQLAKDCYSCHSADYNSTKNPNHAAAGYSKLCETCHTLNPGWKPATFDHSKFPLNLGHSVPVCSDCHTNGNYTSTPTDCYSCHATDYASAKNPDHAAAGYSKLCETCHTLNPGWKPSTFDHSKFSLTLGHAGLNCTDCHIGGNYTNTPTDCYACHKTNYDNTTNPGHAKLSFSTTCTTCHTTNPGWKPATYAQHDAQSFKIYSGAHRGNWTTCSDCHTDAASYAIYTCLTCHNKADMDSRHNGRQGYSYSSTACFNCHPRV